MKVQIEKGEATDTYLVVAENNGNARAICLSHDECIELYGKIWAEIIMPDELQKYENRRRRNESYNDRAKQRTD